MARVIDLGSRWSPLIEGMGSLAGAYGGMLRKEKELESLEDMGLDFSTPEKSIESGYKLIEYNIKKGNIPEARQWYTILSEAEAARAAKKGGGGSPASASALGGTISNVKKWMDDLVAEQSSGNVFDKDFVSGSQEKLERAFAKLQRLGYKDAEASSALRSFVSEQGGFMGINPDLVFDEDAFNRALAAQTGGIMQQPSGGGSALMGTAPPKPNFSR